MINIQSNGSTVEVKIDTSVGYHYSTKITCGDNVHAILLSQDLNDKMRKHLSKIREEAYLEGWNDKLKRKPKSTWWSGRW